MNKKLLIVLAVAVVAVGGAVVFKGSHPSDEPMASASPTPTLSSMPSATPTPSRLPATSVKPTPTATPPGIIIHESQILRVNIEASGYSPATITAQRGDLVVFNNMDSVGHTVTADGGAFDSTTIGVNQSWNLPTANLVPGTYTFHCTLHPSVYGTLIVQ